MVRTLTENRENSTMTYDDILYDFKDGAVTITFHPSILNQIAELHIHRDCSQI